jgi:hypothetical protein
MCHNNSQHLEFMNIGYTYHRIEFVIIYCVYVTHTGIVINNDTRWHKVLFYKC